MSYILDALKKAAEQREAHAPAMRRLFSSPTPDVADSPRWRLAIVGGAAAVAGAAIAVWAVWPARPVVTETRAAKAAPTRVQAESGAVTPLPAPARVQPESSARSESPPAAPSPAVARPTPPKSTAHAKVVAAEKRVPVPPTAAPQTRPAEPPEPVRPAPTPAVPSPAIAAARPTPVPAAAPTPAVSAPRGDASGGQMRLEVIVYSDERARRLAFINGRKYVEGDVLLDGSRIQEIQPNAVVIVDDGRRVVLRP